MPARGDPFHLIVKSLLTAALIALLVLALLRLLDLLILVFGAAILGTLIRGFADLIERRTPLSARLSLAAALLVLLGALIGTGWLFATQFAGDFPRVGQTMAQSWTALAGVVARIPGGEAVAAAMRQPSLPSDNLIPHLTGAVSWVVNAALDLVIFLFATVFIAAEPGLYRRGIVLLVPKKHRALANEALIEAGAALRQWVIGLFVVMVFIGTFTALGLWAIGVPSPAALGLIAGMFELIPYLGPVLSAVPVLAMAATRDTHTMVLAAILMVVVHQIEASLVAPLAAKRVVSLPPALSVFGVIAGGMLFGPVGFIFASPVLVVAYVLVKRLYVEETLHTPTHVPGRDPE
jgi:predicted PurR-regulated permease PerM